MEGQRNDMNDLTLLAVNGGSSSVKASLFQGNLRLDFHYAHIGQGEFPNHAAAYGKLIADLDGRTIHAVGHRITHGGDVADAARIFDDRERERLQNLAPLAPLHQPNNLLGAALFAQKFSVPQVACFDTAFHTTLPELAQRLAIPQESGPKESGSAESGFKRYGFHGLAYANVARVLPDLLGELAKKRVIVAHLGSGASLCLLENLQSMDTTMSLTPLGGLPMATRSGELDPGVVLELVKRHGLDRATQMLYRESGLLALSRGLSGNMQILLGSDTADSHFAVAYFCRSVAAAIGALVAKAGGVEALVFTGGIGQHSAVIRANICASLAFLGIRLSSEENNATKQFINITEGKPVLTIKVDEEFEIARLTAALMQSHA